MDVNRYSPGTRLDADDLVEYGRELVSDQDPCTAFFIKVAETLCCCCCGDDYFNDYFKERAVQHIERTNIRLLRQTIKEIAKELKVGVPLLQGIAKDTNKTIWKTIDADRKDGKYEIMGKKDSPLFDKINKLLDTSIIALNPEKMEERTKKLTKEIKQEKTSVKDLTRQLKEIDQVQEVASRAIEGEIPVDDEELKDEVFLSSRTEDGENPLEPQFEGEVDPKVHDETNSKGKETENPTDNHSEESDTPPTSEVTTLLVLETEEAVTTTTTTTTTTLEPSKATAPTTFFELFEGNPIVALSYLLINLIKKAVVSSKQESIQKELASTTENFTNLGESLLGPFLEGFKAFPIGLPILGMLEKACTQLRDKVNPKTVKQAMLKKVTSFISKLNHEDLLAIKAVIDKLPDFTALAFSAALDLPDPKGSTVEGIVGTKLGLTMEALGIKKSDKTHSSVEALLTLIFTHYDDIEKAYQIGKTRDAIGTLVKAFDTEKDALDHTVEALGEVVDSLGDTFEGAGNFVFSIFDSPDEKRAREQQIAEKKQKQLQAKQEQIVKEQEQLQAEQDQHMKMGLRLFIKSVLINNIDRFGAALG